MSDFAAVLVTRDEEKRQSASLTRLTEADLMEGEVTVAVSHSTVNYKDGLAVTGKLPVVKRWPMVPGVDFVGTVTASTSPDFKVGDSVMNNGWGVGEVHLGGWSEVARVKAEWLIKKPDGLSPFDCMAVGTAGYTAMLAIDLLEKHGLKPADGPAIITGAAGGVGSVGIMLMAKLGWEVIAVTGRPEEAGYLKELGAAEIVDRAEFAGPAKLLAKERWAAGIDNAGGTTLAHVLSMTQSNGAIVACGNAGGMDLPTSVAPFILRGVSLIGVNSVYVPRPTRERAWARLAELMDRERLAAMTTTIPLTGAIDAARAIAEGKIRGRFVVTVKE